MNRTTVDFGIDLGTTNSILAVHNDAQTEVIPNRDKDELTPSAIAFGPSGQMFVGRKAREQYFYDVANAEIEFKLRMGLGERGAKYFPNAHRSMLPEEMSAEVLKALLEAGQARLGEVIRAAVVTVPAAFGALPCQATKVAAEKAHLSRFLLLLEPVAAAMAYGFANAGADSFWMVYDFGGGTFDASITQVRDGIVQVIEHAGDQNLGGKLLDWDIVDQVLAPVLTRQFHLPDFDRSNPRWNTAFAILKILAEQAKIDVCRAGQAKVMHGDGELWRDARNQPVVFDVPLSPDTLIAITLPYFARTDRLCRTAIEQAGLRPDDIRKFILVGGSTLSPFLRTMIVDAFGRQLEYSIDPLTVVARGAAVFAATMPAAVEPRPASRGHYTIDLQYQPVGMELTAPVGGRVKAPAGHSLAEHTIEFREKKSQWSSGKILLDETGTFTAGLVAEPDRKCYYDIILLSPSAQRIATTPDMISYKPDSVAADLPLSEAISVAMADNRVDTFFPKGIPLTDSLSTHRTHRCAYSIPAGQDRVVFRVPLVEGDDPRADRNRLIGRIEISPVQFSANLPAGSDVDITLSINRSRLLKATAYVRFLDQSFEEVIRLNSVAPDRAELVRRLDEQRSRLEKIRTSAAIVGGEPRARQIVVQIQRERTLEQTEAMLKAGEHDAESLSAAEDRLRGLVRQVDRAEDSLEWSILLLKAENAFVDVRKTVAELGTAPERELMLALQQGLDEAIKSGHAMLVRAKLDAAVELHTAIRMRTDEFWINVFKEVQQELKDRANEPQIRELIDLGQNAIDTGDRAKLESAVRQLISHLQLASQEALAQGFGASTISNMLHR